MTRFFVPDQDSWQARWPRDRQAATHLLAPPVIILVIAITSWRLSNAAWVAFAVGLHGILTIRFQGALTGGMLV